MIKAVLKIGGSLGRSHKLSDLMPQLAGLAPRHGLLVVPGGGILADAIRHCDQQFGLDRHTSHWMAILAMDQYGHLIASLTPNSERVVGLTDARRVLAQGKVPVLLPYTLIYQSDQLPHSWEVTSDSLAAWVAGVAGAQRLILAKCVDGLFNGDPGNNANVELLETISLEQLADCQGVDRHLATILGKNGLDMWVINGNHPERLSQLLEKGRAKGTRLRRSFF
jgi:aspartokinase-like uncharacterized kinase